jgi:hypothetical protein
MQTNTCCPVAVNFMPIQDAGMTEVALDLVKILTQEFAVPAVVQFETCRPSCH